METDYFSPTATPPPTTSLKSHFVELFQTLVVFAAIATAIYWLVAQPHKVSGSSMFPNFKDGDYIITDKLTYRFSPPKRGDVVVFKNPRDESQDFIKRVIGISGDVVRVQGGQPYLNGKKIDQPFLKPDVITNSGAFLQEGVDFTVPPDDIIAFGDNRPHSSDSREWGLVKNSEIIGKVFLRYWPANEIGLFPAAYSIQP